MLRVSVVIPCFNHGLYLPETLASLESQSFRDFEIIIVDDGSTDQVTLDLFNRLDHRGMKVIRTENKGVSAARNLGIAEAAGPLIMALDADDYVGPDYLNKAVTVFEENPTVGIVFCERQMFGERAGIDPLPNYDARHLLVENLIYPVALFWKEDWAAVGGYNEAMTHGWEDWDFWIALSQFKRSVVKIPEVLFFYRVRSSSRDHSLHFLRKLQMFWFMVLRNRKLYIQNGTYVLMGLCRIHLPKWFGIGV